MHQHELKHSLIMAVHVVLILLHLFVWIEVRSTFLTHLRTSDSVEKWLSKHPRKLVSFKTATRTRGIPVGNELRVHPHSPPASFPTGEPVVTHRPFALVSCLIRSRPQRHSPKIRDGRFSGRYTWNRKGLSWICIVCGLQERTRPSRRRNRRHISSL